MHVIRLSTIKDFHRHEHSLALHCPTCDRWVDVDLPAMMAAGKRDLPVCRARFRCSVCGTIAAKQVRPPVPRPGGVVGYI